MGDPGSLPGIGQYLITVTLTLAIVLALAVGFIYLMRRLMPQPTSGRTIRLLESVPLEPRRSLHLVGIADRVMLLGSTEGGVSMLTEFDKGQVDVQEPKPPAARRFIDLLRGRKS
jgi:flagellar biosynthetic protein FliO